MNSLLKIKQNSVCFFFLQSGLHFLLLLILSMSPLTILQKIYLIKLLKLLLIVLKNVDVGFGIRYVFLIDSSWNYYWKNVFCIFHNKCKNWWSCWQSSNSCLLLSEHWSNHAGSILVHPYFGNYHFFYLPLVAQFPG